MTAPTADPLHSPSGGPGEIVEHEAEIAGVRTFWLTASRRSATPILYVHGVPTGSWDWLPFLRRTGGTALDLPGFARSAKPDDFEYTIAGYGRFVEAFCDETGHERLALVVHDFGGVALEFAQRHPERIERLVIFDCVALIPGYRWHRYARIWRTPGLGEVFMATWGRPRWVFKQLSREVNATPGPMPDEFIDSLLAGLDRGTKRAILKLYRASPEALLERAGARLGDIRCPALVLWATDDVFLPIEFGRRYAEALGGDVTFEEVERAGHWLWLDRPELVERTATFLESSS